MSASVEPWTDLGEDRVGYDGFIKVVVRRLRMPDGTEVEWDLLDTPASVAVFALTDDDQVVLVEQFRPGPGRVVRSLPGGIIDPGEGPEEAAARELLEETGYSARELEVLSAIEPVNATRPWWAVLARGATRTASQSLDDYEDIGVVLQPVDEVRRAARDGQIGSLVQIYLALDRLGRL